MLLWSMSFIWSKLAFEVYNPFTVLFFRLCMAGIMLYLVARFFKWIQTVDKKDFKLLLLLSFFEPFLYFIGENFGLQLVSPGTAAIIISTIPLFMPIIGRVFFKERFSIYNIIGVSISLIGVLFVILNKDLSLSGNPIGFGLLFLAVFSALGYTVVLKKITYKYNAFTIVLWQNIFASMAFLPLFLIFEFDAFSKVGFTDYRFSYIVLLAIFASNGAFLLYTYALKFFGVSKVGVFSNLIPVFTLVISFYIFNEQLSLIKYLGVALVILGLIVSEQSASKKGVK